MITPEQAAPYEREIRRLSEAIEAITAQANANTTRYASDLAAERMAGTLALRRFREAIHAGCLDVTQVRATKSALGVIERGRVLGAVELRALAVAFLATVAP